VTDGRFEPELGLALDLADRSGRLLTGRFGKVESIRYKSAKDVVTEADHLSEELILAAIREAFPDDGVLAEESGGSPGRGGLNGRVWVVDPLDGTINYANGIPLFCVSIALVVDGRSSVGVVRDPIRGETFAATAAGPATLDGRPIRASAKPLLSDYVLSLALDGSATSERLRRIHAAVRVTRRLGSAALALSYAGCGRFDAYAQTDGLNAWDVAAAGLIAERAGATVSRIDGDGPWLDLDGRAGTFGVVAAPPVHHAELLDLVRPAARGRAGSAVER
jgi:myo-inositol-1(or 4)-monophosphatase